MNNYKHLYITTTFFLILLSSIGECAPWPLTILPRAGDDKLGNGLLIHTGENGICDTEVHPDSDDVQLIPVGQGKPNEVCITAGPDAVIDAGTVLALGGDDQKVGETITTGANGICETVADGDDVPEIPLNQGAKEAHCITAGVDGILGYHPQPQGFVNTLGENTVTWMKLHEGVDFPGPIGTACIALRAGQSWASGGSGEQSYVDVTVYDDGISYFRYFHTAWEASDGLPPGIGSVAANRVVGRLVAHSAFPHLHLDVGKYTVNNEEEGTFNALKYLSPKPTYDEEFPKIETRANDVPAIFIVPDKSQFLISEEYIDNGQTPFIRNNADVVVEVHSQAWDFYEPGYTVSLGNHKPILPYEAIVEITGKTSNYSFSRTLFRMDLLPGDGTKRAEKADLIYHKLSEPYSKFYLILTNSDGSENYDYLNNVVESNWPVGEKDEEGEWLVPNDEYTVTVTIKDYEGQQVSNSRTVKVDRGFQKPPVKN